MSTFVLVHGSWLGGWCWKRLQPLIQSAGHDVLTPTLTGLGDRAHLGGASVDLRLHVRDLCAVLSCEDVERAILVGHSYAGMVVTGAADALPERVAQIIYLDAVIPEPQMSILDCLPPDMAASLRDAAQATGTGCFPPASPAALGIESVADAAWVEAHSVAMPLATHTQALQLTGAHAQVKHRAYIRCVKPPLAALDRAVRQAKLGGWPYFELETGHDPMITTPGELAQVLLHLAAA